MSGGHGGGKGRGLRSQEWFGDLSNPGVTSLYLERYLNFGLTREELQGGRPIIAIAQTGSDLAPCNRHHLDLAQRVKDGVRDAGGIALEFPCHPIQETGKRPTPGLDRNLTYLACVEVLHGYPIDGVVLTTGCDKTTPALIMAAATVNLPAIVLSGGPMLDGHRKGRDLIGAGTVVWEARQEMAAGRIDSAEFMEMVAAGAPSIGHCNTMGTATSMNCLAEALGLSLSGCAAIPAPYRERGQMAYRTGIRAVELVHEDLRPSDILTREAFENAIVACSAIGGSSNCPIHINAIARHMGVPLTLTDWQDIGYDLPLLVDCQPAGRFLGEAFHNAGGLPAVLRELLDAGVLRAGARTVSGRTMGEEVAEATCYSRDVIRPFGEPLKGKAGFAVLSGNLFDGAIMKTSVISESFRQKYLMTPGDEDAFEGRAIVFEGPEDYHDRINDPDLAIDEHCILVIRGCGPIGYPGAAEVVNMQPPDALIRRGITELPCIGDGRQSGTSGSPSILNASPEAAVGGGLALLRTGDRLRIDLKQGRADALVDPAEWAARQSAWSPRDLPHQTPWEQFFRQHTGQLSEGACLDFATRFQDVLRTAGTPRHSH